MFGWLVRILMVLAGVITSWFVGRDSHNYEIIQSMFALLLVAFFIAIAAFWPNIAAFIRGRRT